MVGGIAASPVAVKADASVNVTVQVEASMDGGLLGKVKANTKAKPDKVSEPGVVTKATTKAGIAKGKGPMRTSINVNKKSGGKKASSLPGE